MDLGSHISPKNTQSSSIFHFRRQKARGDAGLPEFVDTIHGLQWLAQHKAQMQGPANLSTTRTFIVCHWELMNVDECMNHNPRKDRSL